MQGFDLRRRVRIDDLIQLLGEATVRGALFDLGRYPAAVRADGRVRGELYQIRDADVLLPRVDAVEGYDPSAPGRSQYVRDTVRVTTARGRSERAWVYFYARGLGDAVWIPDGDYRAHVGRHRGLCYDLKVSPVAGWPPERCT